MVKAGGRSDWREVVCDNMMASELIRSVQLALKAAGFDPGPIDNIMGSLTKAALVKYQKAKNLPSGNLDADTMKSLGVKYK